tara:strand:+ start:116 stop:256 length:141 start_codon:yes stop_codon:yes gene_type:complete
VDVVLVEKGDNLNPFNKREKVCRSEINQNLLEKKEPVEVDTTKKNQ